MQVIQASPRRLEVAEAIRKKAQPLEAHLSSPPTRAAYDELMAEVRMLEGAPGETLADGRAILAEQSVNLRRKRNVLLATGGVMLAAAAATALMPDSSLVVAVRLAGMTGGVGTFVWGATVGDALGRNDRLSGFLQAWEEHYPRLAAGAPAGGGTLVRSTLELAASENMKSELIQVMQATEDYLAAQPPEPSVQAALRQVRSDRAVIEKAPGESLEGMRELASQDTMRSNQLSRKLLVASLAAFGVSLASIALHLAPAVTLVTTTGVAGLAVRAGTLTDHEARNNYLIGTVNRWELQLDGLKNVARSAQDVQDLAQGMNGQGSGVQERESHVVVGGIRVPVRIKSAEPTAS
ncbi:hypothetical protein DYH09_13085 [bacterium CPR1]|nr:hypothetical protein [bacterium CPR1]